MLNPKSKIAILLFAAAALVSVRATEAQELNYADSERFLLETFASTEDSAPFFLDLQGIEEDSAQFPLDTRDTDQDGDPNFTDLDDDNDTLSDLEEAVIGTDPPDPDTDGDGLMDNIEVGSLTDPFNPDTDGDGYWDGAETILGRDPTDSHDRPNVVNFRQLLAEEGSALYALSGLSLSEDDLDGDGFPDFLELGILGTVLGQPHLPFHAAINEAYLDASFAYSLSPRSMRNWNRYSTPWRVC